MFIIKFKVSGLTCSSCVRLIEKQFSKVNGITAVSVNLDGDGEVSSDREIFKDELQTALAGLNYKIS